MSKSDKLMLVFGAIFLAISPVLFYWHYSQVPTFEAEQVNNVLANPKGSAILIDIRSATDYQAGHLQGAINIAYDDIIIEPGLTAKKLIGPASVFVLCDGGISSIRVVRLLRERGVNAINIRDGLAGWITRARPGTDLAKRSFLNESGRSVPVPFRDSPFHHQVATITTAFIVKPLYMLFSLVIVLLLCKKSEPELSAIKWAMLFFFGGEAFCAANYLTSVYNDNKLLEYLHIAGMLICFGLIVFTSFEWLDRHVVHYSSQKRTCSLKSYCPTCIKNGAPRCGLQQFFTRTGIMAGFLCLLPIFASPNAAVYNTKIFDAFYTYSHPEIFQIVEFRIFPAMAAGLFFVGAIILWKTQSSAVLWSKVLFSAAGGIIGFALFRFVLFYGFRDNLVWFEVWEEITEFAFIILVLIWLWIFHNSVFTLKSTVPDNTLTQTDLLK